MPQVPGSQPVKKNTEHGSLLSQKPRLSQPKVFQLSQIARVGLLFSLVLMSLPLPVTAQSSSTWTAPYFIVQPMDPWKSIMNANGGNLPETLSFTPIANFITTPTTQSKDASGYLVDVGKIYASIGLKEPIFGPVPNSNTHFVYMFTFPGSLFESDITNGFATYLPKSCIPVFKESWMALNTNTNGIELYRTVAHELFHPIQYQYPFKKGNCGGREWIFEGTADAAGIFLMEKKMKEDGLPLPAGKDKKFYGVRAYDVPLHQDPSWGTPGVKSRFGTKIGAYDLPSIYSYFGYRTSSFWRYLMDRRFNQSTWEHAPKRLKALAEFMNKNPPASPPTLKAWLDWVAESVDNTWGSFYQVYPEFLAEFAAWPGSKYNNLTAQKVLDLGFGGCGKPVILTPEHTTGKITLNPRKGTTLALYPISGRCIQVTLKGFPKKAKLKLEMTTDPISKNIADQLVLGFAREEHGKTLYDNCYDRARRVGRAQPKKFGCLYFGKVKGHKGAAGKNTRREWRFDPHRVKHPNSTTTFILTNVKATTASSTVGIPQLTLHIGFPSSKGKTDKGKLGTAKSSALAELPDITIPQRQLLYGIKKKSAISTGYSMNLSPIKVAALDDAGKKAETYAILPLKPVAFRQTGPFQAMVTVENKEGQSDLSANLIGSQYCAPDSQPGSIGAITRSDDEILEIAIDTPLCQLSVSDIMACADGCPVVDHFKGTLSLPFGWRYFAENEMEDLVTPGVLLDIDRYHHEVFGTPLQGLSSSSGGSGSGNDNSGPAIGTSNGGGDSQGGTIPPCDCSCEAYEKLKKAKDQKVRDFEFLGQMLQCAQECAKPHRDCRRAKRNH